MRRLDVILSFLALIHLTLSLPHLTPSAPNPDPVPFHPSQLQQPPQPHPPQPPRQADALSSLRIPTCALSCYLEALPDDGCELELDLKCHCSTGNLLGKTYACVHAACTSADQETVNRRVTQACQAVGINPRLPSIPTSTLVALPSSRAASTEAATTSPPIYSMIPTSRATLLSKVQSSNLPSNSSATSTTTASVSVGSMSLPPLRTSTSASTSTGTSLAVPVSEGGLSDGAKAGISISVISVASAVFAALSFYIRRLKRQLALATAAADVPESVLRSPSHRHSGIPEALLTPSRRRSLPTASRNRRLSDSPISPLSPIFIRNGGRRSSIAGMLQKKRGNVLSVVLERDDEDASSLMERGRSIREPVPGQSEGLTGPLEMDGQFVAIFEAPTSITPRARSMERDEEREDWKEHDFGKI